MASSLDIPPHLLIRYVFLDQFLDEVEKFQKQPKDLRLSADQLSRVLETAAARDSPMPDDEFFRRIEPFFKEVDPKGYQLRVAAILRETLFREASSAWTDADVERAAKCSPKLAAINFRDPSAMTSKGFSSLAPLPLEYLGFAYTSISDNDLDHIRTPTLREFNLYRCRRITDLAVSHIIRMSCLEGLVVRETRISDRGLQELLANLPSLRVIDVSYCDNVSDYFVQRCRKVYKRVKIIKHHEYGPSG